MPSRFNHHKQLVKRTVNHTGKRRKSKSIVVMVIVVGTEREDTKVSIMQFRWHKSRARITNFKGHSFQGQCTRTPEANAY